jgi:hypothetical protein
MVQGRTIPADQIVKDYWQAFKLVYGQEPKAYYLGNGWYSVNGEIVYRRILEHEIAHLRDLARKQRKQRTGTSKSTIQRLIQKLRLM